MTILDPAVQAASASLVAAHKRVVKEKDRQINALQAEKGELQRALQAKAAEVVKAKLETIRAIDDAIDAHKNADAAISYLDQPTLTAITNLGEALDTLSRAWPGHFDIDLAVKSSDEQIARWHQEDGVTEWYFGHKEQS